VSAPREWPPLVGAGRIPLAVRVRDVLLTLAAWAVLAWLLRDAMVLAWDYLRAPFFELTKAAPPDWPALWARLRPFAVVSAALVAWLVYWALVRRRRIQALPPSPQPPALHVAQEARALGLDPAEVARWREWRVAVVEFDAAGRPTAAREAGG
jgi:poly-beta-1,6-N-acetyl-D-glucosamine biosynthesis protein PgaD